MYVVYVQIRVIIKQDVGQRDIKRTNNRHLSLKYHKFSFNFGQYKRSDRTVIPTLSCIRIYQKRNSPVLIFTPILTRMHTLFKDP